MSFCYPEGNFGGNQLLEFYPKSLLLIMNDSEWLGVGSHLGRLPTFIHPSPFEEGPTIS
jgi:hypothetical protein